MHTKLININKLSNGERYQILREYIENVPMSQIAKDNKLPIKSIEGFIAKFYKEFTTSKELHSIVGTGNNKYTQLNYRKPSYICDKLIEKIEDEGADLVYAYAYHLTKDNIQALKESGLYNINKIKDSSKVNQVAHKLKGQYLRSLPRVKDELKRLRDLELKDTNVSPEYIQSALLEQLEQLNSYEYLGIPERQLLLRTLELLGKSVGTFSEKVTLETLSPNDALDKLINMTKSNTVSTGTYVMEE